MVKYSLINFLWELFIVFSVQKQRASRSEDALEQLQAQLLEKDQKLAEVGSDTEGIRSRLDKITKEKAQAQAENVALKT